MPEIPREVIRRRLRNMRGRNPRLLPRRVESLRPINYELPYRREIQKIITFQSRSIRSLFDERIDLIFELARMEGIRQDTSALEISQIFTQVRLATSVTIETFVSNVLPGIFQTMSNRSKRNLERKARDAVGVDVFLTEPYLEAQLTSFVAENTELIQNLTNEQSTNMMRIVSTGVRDGLSRAEMSRQITQRVGIGRRHARLIARDQINKSLGELDRLRYQELGVQRAIWRTSMDEKVRTSHKEVNGDEFDLSKGITLDRVPNVIPGQPVQCRCIADPIFSSVLDD